MATSTRTPPIRHFNDPEVDEAARSVEQMTGHTVLKLLRCRYCGEEVFFLDDGVNHDFDGDEHVC